MDTQHMVHDFQGVVVQKPWGYEYQMYSNGTIALWYLHIAAGRRTSLHCHPRKKTGLIILSGQAEVSFLNDAMTLGPLGKIMIRPGLFHATRAISPEGITLIEVETPCDKENLVRLDDEYDRTEKPYEGADALRPMDETCVQIPDPVEDREQSLVVDDCVLTVRKIADSDAFKQWPLGDLVLVLEHGLYSVSGEPVLGPADVVSSDTLRRLAETFSAPYGASLLSIRHQDETAPIP